MDLVPKTVDGQQMWFMGKSHVKGGRTKVKDAELIPGDSKRKRLHKGDCMILRNKRAGSSSRKRKSTFDPNHRSCPVKGCRQKTDDPGGSEVMWFSGKLNKHGVRRGFSFEREYNGCGCECVEESNLRGTPFPQVLDDIYSKTCVNEITSSGNPSPE
ncbi:hypothetical protein CEXT_615301 [Caerostris extrusa]|uniref:Uncharacterized protein n=1 Tax=Caerostris extrusa TaxID=172846 RepID=A0AAV4SUF4_CAEEX|nr:hypothetical protein CEXT_615301 [Caerostris extrusa]